MPATVDAGQDKPRLTMTLSSNVVSPGSNLSVTVASPSGETFDMVAVIGTGSIGMKGENRGAPGIRDHAFGLADEVPPGLPEHRLPLRAG